MKTASCALHRGTTSKTVLLASQSRFVYLLGQSQQIAAKWLGPYRKKNISTLLQHIHKVSLEKPFLISIKAPRGLAVAKHPSGAPADHPHSSTQNTAHRAPYRVLQREVLTSACLHLHCLTLSFSSVSRAQYGTDAL